jgi:hypothetical protein
MRLGKEQAAGYVEDTEADAPAEAITIDTTERMPLAPAAEPSLPVS